MNTAIMLVMNMRMMTMDKAIAALEKAFDWEAGLEREISKTALQLRLPNASENMLNAILDRR
jgi:hypothetical protein